MYVVEITPSARRISEAAAEQVAERGPIRAFESKAAAREWIEAEDGVRIQDAAPNDPAAVDGYLVADPARRRAEREPAGEPARLDAF